MPSKTITKRKVVDKPTAKVGPEQRREPQHHRARFFENVRVGDNMDDGDVGGFHCANHDFRCEFMSEWNEHLVKLDHHLVGSSMTCQHCGARISLDGVEITSQDFRRVKCKECNRFTKLEMPSHENKELKNQVMPGTTIYFKGDKIDKIEKAEPQVRYNKHTREFNFGAKEA